MKKKRQPRAFAFVQDWGCYPEQTLVLVGTKDAEDLFKMFKKLKVNFGIAKQTLKYIKEHGFGTDTDTGCFLWVDGEAGRMTILYLKEWPKKPTWKNYQTLMHELHHAVAFVLCDCRGMEKEREAQAYAQEMMFQNIRRKLDGQDKEDRVTLY